MGAFLASHHHVTSVGDRIDCGIQVERDGDSVELRKVEVMSALFEDGFDGREELLVPRLSAPRTMKAQREALTGRLARMGRCYGRLESCDRR